MSKKTLRIERRRFIYDGDEMINLIICYFNQYGTELENSWFKYLYANENDFLENELFGCIGNQEVRSMKNGIVGTVLRMREDDDRVGRGQKVEITIVPREELKPHSSCKMNFNKGSSPKIVEENGVSQSKLKQKLEAIDKENKVLKFFEDNKCSVCLSNYKEILDEDLHIVIPSCGHPLCCKCADNLLESKKECPQCKVKITADSFNLMKFNADLQIDARNQRVFL